MPRPSRCAHLLLSFACSLLLLSACGKESGIAGAPADRIYRVGTDASYAPMEMLSENKQLTGFDIDLMRAIADKGGLRVEFVNTPFESIFNFLVQGDRDILISAITITDQRRQSIDFSDPYFEARQLIALPKDNMTVTQASDLKPLKIGVQSATTGDFAAQKLLGSNSTAIKRFESMPLALSELAAGGVDAVIGDEAVIMHFIKTNGKNGVRPGFRTIADDGFDKEFYGIAVRKGEAALLLKINQGLAAAKADGTYERLKKTYFGS
ncbi:basic amino acid ABC transporter substrate-binding protein [Herbaspirillum sp. SJZ099]|uniref:basic amino acid ABC transporter substrate-binding protein n=1 Tax=Herbaspirillum sp. SJZ099 TaxID=2572916 RepID=UPI0011A965EE|nr:basic amino acid ABC transporter substrate-binding protein [Herbaspirillum sp. SJZ099]TWC69713.1 polar amino acid transport system substrate-binding protein [Herbaspirillum sp. SJZ099]